MSLLKKAGSRKRKIETGEEQLHEQYNFKTEKGKVVTVFASADGGSTQTRVTIVEDSELDQLETKITETYVIPSISVAVPDDRKIAPKSEDLYDIMDSSITNTSGRKETIFEKVRLVRGTKATDVEIKENRLKSKIQKTADPTFYYNILEGLGYGTCLKYGGNIPETVEVYLGVALPPDDKNEINQKRLSENLEKYSWTHLESGVTINFVFKGVTSQTEPEAAVKGYYVLSGEEQPEYVLHIEGGGRSIGVDLLKDGQSVSTAQKTLEFGGNQLKEIISELYVAKNGGRPLSSSVLEDAVRTGFLRQGNSKIDIMPLISEAMTTIAFRIEQDIMEKVFDQQSKIGIDEMNVISASGRFFKETKRPTEELADGTPEEVEEDQYSNGISVANYLAQRFAALAPNSIFKHIEGNFIPAGLLLYAILEFTEDESEQEVATADEELLIIDSAPNEQS